MIFTDVEEGTASSAGKSSSAESGGALHAATTDGRECSSSGESGEFVSPVVDFYMKKHTFEPNPNNIMSKVDDARSTAVRVSQPSSFQKATQ